MGWFSDIFGGDSGSSSQSLGSASANVTFTPTIAIGSNRTDPAGQDTGSTFAAQLLAAPPVRMPEDTPAKDNGIHRLLLYVAAALAVRKVLRG